ncbi:MAG: Ig-like domain-containing protein, partial [Candidatus Margulisbacteria bacterium]|nr:Ig-like domain-containing protein [Candidatus Margulisiibacteriota bacterium]
MRINRLGFFLCLLVIIVFSQSTALANKDADCNSVRFYLGTPTGNYYFPVAVAGEAYNGKGYPSTINLEAGYKYKVEASFKNTGTDKWTASSNNAQSYKLGLTTIPDSDKDETWEIGGKYLYANRYYKYLSSIGTNISVLYTMYLTIPTFTVADPSNTTGYVYLKCQMMQEQVAWFGKQGLVYANIVDTQAPSNPTLSVSKTLVIKGGSVTLTAAATDYGTPAGVQYYYEMGKSGIGWVMIQDWTTTKSITFKNFTYGDGTYEFRVKTRDRWGNTNNTYGYSGKVTYDGTPPNAPTMNNPSYSTSLKPTWTWASGGGGIGKFMYVITSYTLGWNVAPYVETYDKSFTPANNLPEGRAMLSVAERDDSGNLSAWTQSNIFIDATAPGNISTINCKQSTSTGTVIPANTWTNLSNPYFYWDPAIDPGSTANPATGSGVKDYLIYWGTDPNAEPVTAIVSRYYRPSGLVSGNIYYFKIKARDKAGNTSPTTATFVYKFDNQPPTGTVSINNGADSTTTLEVTLTVYSSDPNVAYMSFQNRYASAEDWEPYATSKLWTLRDTGDNPRRVYVRFKDNAGNFTPANDYSMFDDINYLPDSTQPTVASFDPANGATAVPLNKSIVLTFSEAINKATFAYTLSPDPGGTFVSWNSSNTVATISHPDFALGTSYIITIDTAADPEGNQLSGTKSISFTSTAWVGDDSTPPTSTIDAIDPFYGPNKPLDSVTGTASDTLSGIQKVEVSIQRNSDNKYWAGGTTWQEAEKWLAVTLNADNTWAYTLPTTKVDSVTYTIKTKATDNAGNIQAAPTTASFTWDTQPPTGMIIIEGGAASTPTLAVTITVAATDPAGVIEMSFQNRFASQAAYEDYATSKLWTLKDTGDNPRRVYARFKDNAGNFTPANDYSVFDDINYLPDSTPPTVASFDPAGGATAVPVNQQIVITFSEAVDTASFAYTLSPDPGGRSVAWSSGNTVATISHNNFNTTTGYTLTITTANDLAGNTLSGTKSTSFTSAAWVGDDSTAPTSTIDALDSFYGPNKPLNSVTGTASDTLSGIQKVEVSIQRNSDNKYWASGTTWQEAENWLTTTLNIDNTWTQTLPAKENGVTYTIKAKATDNVGNIQAAPTTASFTWDSASPTVTSFDPANGATAIPVNQQIVITFSEAVDTVSFAYTLSPDPGGRSVAWSSGNTVATISHNDFNTATGYTLTITTANDLAGNTLAGTESTSFTSAASPVAVSLTFPAGGEIWKGGAVKVITWTNSGGAPNHFNLAYSTDGGATYNYSISDDITGDAASYSWTLPAIDSAQVKVRLQAHDAAHNPVSTSYSGGNLTIDSTPPTSTIDAIDPFYGPNKPLDSVTGTASDTLSGIQKVEVSIQRNSDNKYWAGGTTWQEAENWLTTTLNIDNTWTYTLPATKVDSVTYTIK